MTTRTATFAAAVAALAAIWCPALAQGGQYDQSYKGSSRHHSRSYYRSRNVRHPKSMEGKTNQFSKNVNHETNRESKDFNHTTNRWSKNVNHFFQGKHRKQ